jgi:hypothetical protein
VRRVLHLVRAGQPDPGAVDLLHDWRVDDRAGTWVVSAETAPPPAPLQPGPIDADALIQLVLTADLVAVW